jgi:predicted hydrocarbon binding protein
MDTSGSVYFYPNRMGRIIFLAIEEILGRNGVNRVLNIAGLPQFIDHYPPNNHNLEFSFHYLSRLQNAIEEFYGPHGGRGVALRIGRASFQHGLREYGALLGFTDMAFRLLPLSAKLKIGSSAFADIFNKYSDQRVRLEDREGTLLWHIERCPLCWERHSDSASCQMAAGLLQEALYWVSGGKYFRVEEVHCIANGDATCTFAIDKVPMS